MAQNARLSIGQAGGVPQGEANTDELQHERHILENLKEMKKAQAPHPGEKKTWKARAPYSGEKKPKRLKRHKHHILEEEKIENHKHDHLILEKTWKSTKPECAEKHEHHILEKKPWKRTRTVFWKDLKKIESRAKKGFWHMMITIADKDKVGSEIK